MFGIILRKHFVVTAVLVHCTVVMNFFIQKLQLVILISLQIFYWIMNLA